MNGSIRPDLYNVIMIGGIGLVAVFLWNRIMNAAGQTNLMT
jgi:hypothetical protein